MVIKGKNEIGRMRQKKTEKDRKRQNRKGNEYESYKKKKN